ncbi:MAG: phosphoribosylglycinamide formyltransferase [Rickettsiales bacterium]|nr:phosphoribosylglycinamide formyltransferase [Rickettsiales bacterium]|tara:strand:- start:3478 stop:4017 length:540 start_codon:yes stop_codon:yes gene_type:complete
MVSIVDTASAQQWPLKIALVVSDRPEAGGLSMAAERGIATEVIHFRDYRGRRAEFDSDLATLLRGRSIDWVILAGFMRILDAAFVAAFPNRILNIHPSLLPKYPGLDTHRRVLEAGDAVHGCTVHRVTEALDAGPILGQAQVPVLEGDDEHSLKARVLAQEHILYPSVVKKAVCGELEG